MRIRFALMVLMMVVGVNEVKAQNPIADGYYMIASSGGPNNGSSKYTYSASNPENNFYLCPATACYYNTSANTSFLTANNGMPHLTTYKCFAHNTVSDAIWYVTSVTVSNTLYYRFYHVASEKYLTYNTGRKISNNTTRLIVHLEAFTTPDENNTLFIVTASDGKFLIRPKNVTETDKALNVSSDNLDQTNPGSNKGGIQGTIGYYNISGNDVAASYWYFEVPKPDISYNSSDNKIVITHMDENANLYYTDDGDSDPATTQTENTGTTPVEISNVNSSVTIKAIAERSGIVSHVSEIRIVPDATISFGSSPIVYNGSAQEPTVTVKDGDDVISSSEYSVSYSNNNTNAGETVTVTITDNAGGDYIVCGSATFTISPKPLTITANNKTITYGDEPANDGVTYSEFAGTETSSVLTGTLAYAYNYSQYGDVGNYTITPSGLSNSNYDITFAPGTLTVNKKEVTVTSGITASDKTYDGTTDATLDGTGAVIEGKIGNDDLTVLAGSGTFADKNVGTDKTVTINSFTFGGAKAGNYQMAASGHQATAQASITPAPVTVTADAKSKGYGDEDPELTYTTTTLQGSDTKATAFTGALTRAAGQAKGTYAITQGTLASANYEITFIGAVFTITNKTLTITAGSDTKVYDGTALTNNTYTNTALLTGDEIESVTVTGSQTVAGSSNNVPSGAVIKNGNNEDVTANYEITYVNGTLEVTQKALTITAGSDTKEYDGTALTKDTYTNTELATGDAITNVTVAGSQTVAGNSNNVPSAAVIKNAGNEDVTASYNITYANGTLTVTQKALTITAGSDTKVYDGTALIKNTYTNTALATGDEITSVTMTGSQTTVGSSNNVPSAAVIKNASNETVTASYNITYTYGTLEVTRASVTVTADNASKVYGGAEPASFTATVTGLVNNESESLITYTVSRASGENAGNYAITPAGDATQGNYAVIFVAGTFTITTKTIGDGTKVAEGMTITMTDNGSGGYTVTVTDGETTLTKDTHYTLSEENDVVTITGIGNYSGSARLVYATATFATQDAEQGYAAAYVSTMDVLAPASVKVCVVQRVNPSIGTVNLLEIDYIPEGVPVILLANNDQTGFAASPVDFNETTPISDAVRNSNQLQVAPDEPSNPEDATSQHGVLVKDTEAYMFYKGEFVLTQEGVISPGKIFLFNPNYEETSTSSPSPSPARCLLFVFGDDETGIEETQLSTLNSKLSTDTWYTLDGRKLSGKPTQRGLYIVNGKKVLVR